MTREQLIELLQRAEEGSPALDREIMIADGWTPDDGSQPVAMWKAPAGRRFPYGAATGGVVGMQHEYPYTRSLDAAVTLVPERWQWGIGTHPWNEIFNPGGAQAYCTKLAPGQSDRVVDGYTHADARTAALALCIAALRAQGAA